MASVSAGILIITPGSDTELDSNNISVTSVVEFSPNTPTIVTVTNVEIQSVSSWS